MKSKLFASLIFITLWLGTIIVLPFLPKWETLPYNYTLGLLVMTSIIGGFGIGTFTLMSYHLVGTSRSKKNKYEIVTLSTVLGSIFGPSVLSYWLIYRFYLTDSTNGADIKYASMFAVPTLLLFFCFIAISRKVGDKKLDWQIETTVFSAALNDYERMTEVDRKYKQIKGPGLPMKTSIFLSHLTFSLCRSFLSLNLIAMNFQKTSSGDLSKVGAKTYKFVKVFDLMEIVMLAAIPYVF